jgi:hypothetical protein
VGRAASASHGDGGGAPRRGVAAVELRGAVARVMVRVEGVGRHGYMASGWLSRAFRSGSGRVLGWGRSGPWFGFSIASIGNTPGVYYKYSLSLSLYIYIWGINSYISYGCFVMRC